MRDVATLIVLDAHLAIAFTATVLHAMTAARTRAAAATASGKRSQTQTGGQVAHVKKRKRSDLDQTTSDSEVKPSSPEVASHKKKQNSIKSDAGEYSGPYPQHNRPTPQECQASLGCTHKFRENLWRFTEGSAGLLKPDNCM